MKYQELALQCTLDQHTGKIYRQGKQVFCQKHNKGYLQGTFMGINFLAHRVAWYLYYGEWPVNQIDHINGVRDDNRIENLRSVTSQENKRNMSLRSDNTSGVMGVRWRKDTKKWQARGFVDGVETSLVYCRCLSGAKIIRKLFEEQNGYSERHGCS